MKINDAAAIESMLFLKDIAYMEFEEVADDEE